jgi:hypothetical protein
VSSRGMRATLLFFTSFDADSSGCGIDVFYHRLRTMTFMLLIFPCSFNARCNI